MTTNQPSDKTERTILRLARMPWRGLMRSLLLILHVVFVVNIGHAWLDAENTNRLFETYVANVRQPAMTETEVALALTRQTHDLLWQAKPLFSPAESYGDQPTKPRWDPMVVGPADPVIHMATAYGSCGSFAMVLAKSFERAGIEFRIVQMICNGTQPGCHIMVEGRVDRRWVLFDPSFNLVFRTPEGQLADYAEVASDWPYYQQQIPSALRNAPPGAEYRFDVERYDFAGVRYTNWNKVPVITPLLKRALDTIMGPDAEYVSLRSYLIDGNAVRLWFWSLGYVLLLLFSMLWFRSRRKNEAVGNLSSPSSGASKVPSVATD